MYWDIDRDTPDWIKPVKKMSSKWWKIKISFGYIGHSFHIRTRNLWGTIIGMEIDVREVTERREIKKNASKKKK